MARITVLRPFRLTYFAPRENAQGKTVDTLIEQQFTPGSVEITEEVADHWYIKNLADGKIEDPRVTADRLVQAAERAAADAAVVAQLQKDAEAQLARYQSTNKEKALEGGKDLSDGEKPESKSGGKKADK